MLINKFRKAARFTLRGTRQAFRPRLEVLESRCLLSIFTVTTVGDDNDLAGGNLDGTTSLREAILQANSDVTPSTINFNIAGAGTHTISPTSGLPIITHTVLIDGYSQPGAHANTQTFGDDAVIAIELNGGAAGAASGLILAASDSTIQGLAIGGFSLNGIGLISGASGNTIQGNFIGTDHSGSLGSPNQGEGVGIFAKASNNLVGGSGAAARNILSANKLHGVGIFDPGTSGNQVQGNFIGTDISGTVALPNGTGVRLDKGASQTTIGGTVAGAGNLISGNGSNGVEINDAPGTGDLVQGNLIGTDITGTAALGNKGSGLFISSAVDLTIGGTAAGAGNLISGNSKGIGMERFGKLDGIVVQGNKIGTDAAGFAPLPNGVGIDIDHAEDNVINVIGGTTPGAGNLISGNLFDGIFIANSNRIRIQGNMIGTDASGTAALGNGRIGILMEFQDVDDIIGGTIGHAGNVIAFNGASGIVMANGAVFSNAGDAILSNSIFSNGGPGINLNGASEEVVPNDKGDGDVGPNHWQNYPVLVSAVGHADGTTTVHGILNSTPSTSFRVEIFASTDADASGFGEGQTFLDAVSVTTDSNGDADFTDTLGFLPAGTTLSSTATDLTTNVNDTSEFSNDIQVINHIPALTSLTPSAVVEGPFTLTVNGSNFANNAVVLLNGFPLATTFVSSAQLVAQVPPGLTEEDIPENVTVSNPGPEGGTSAALGLTIGDATLAALAPLDLSETEGIPFTDVLAVFSDAGGAEPATSYTAFIDWGDQAETLGQVVLHGGNLQVVGTHTYAQEGSYTVVVKLDDEGGSSASAASTIAIVDAPLNGVAKMVAFTEGTPGSRVVATFHDADPQGAAGDYVATIVWGDGSSSPGTVSANGDAFDISGTHGYVHSGTNPVTVTIQDAGGALVIVHSTAVVTPPPLDAQPRNLTVTGNKKFSGTIATFTDPDPRTNPAAYSATVTWDDNTTSSTANGTLRITGSNPFTVAVPGNAQHTFAAFGGTHTISITISDAPGGQNRAITVTDRVVDPPGLDANGGFVAQVYQDLLGRSTDDAGAAFWTGMLDQCVRASLVFAAIESSIEYRGVEVQRVYQQYLHRTADVGGLQFFTNFLVQGGTIEQMVTALFASPEYLQNAGGTSDAFLDTLAFDVLRRNLDTGGRQFFSDLLSHGASAGQVAALFFASDEYQQGVVRGVFNQYLGRDPDSGGLAFFTALLQHGGRDQDVLAAVLNSNEFLAQIT